ncbi:ectoine/hydroxyectoine ABC transporter permease subunit EhuD [Saccharopolyspora oryzae]|uniref:Ectoine/hydroxyectoine ABC transporter permease subunit EhuD n=1 Tax=Saccharopolyspora oryzae TaxID=2997343 RepID=A0ABT4UW73_9PSEU|nr:ectoine/hydroxyectoine ABC transporter permease subunit EhuD [Saccharopolyspora oryzae]MDA3625322.1 ectoine/hydroxyectoine ABC transporter permease subunit EhuD [Saccharopolyspora oryzae]
MIWDWDFALRIVPSLLDGLLVTVQITLLGMAIALVLGLVLAVVRYSKVPVLGRIFGFFVLFVRGTPLLVQAYFAFYVLPTVGVKFSPLITGIIVIGINYSAYTAEVYRAGIQCVPAGQWEAGTALSLSGWQRWRFVVLPQAIRDVVPALGNYLVQMFKDSAILAAITVFELLNHATAIGSSSYRYLEPLTIAGLLFLAVSLPAAKLIKRLELRLAHPR